MKIGTAAASLAVAASLALIAYTHDSLIPHRQHAPPVARPRDFKAGATFASSFCMVVVNVTTKDQPYEYVRDTTHTIVTITAPPGSSVYLGPGSIAYQQGGLRIHMVECPPTNNSTGEP